MDGLHRILDALAGLVWGPYAIAFLVGTGLYLSVRTRFVQFRKFRLATRIVGGEFDDPRDAGEITHFQALAAALSATIGTGNIAGVATAIAAGGPGAVFWMWVTALVGMATKFAECTLSLRFREIDERGIVAGGPMYTIRNGMGPRWRWMGTAFAAFAAIAAFGIGNMVQSNSVADAAAGFAANSVGVEDPRVLVGIKAAAGIALSVLTGLVVIGGIRRIAQVAARLVPGMCILYIAGGLGVVLLHLDRLPEALSLIFRHAFTPTAAAGGFAGAVVMETIRYGVARGVFSNEAGLGSAPMAHAAARTEEPVREGLVAMMGPFIDTIVVCSVTAFVILTTGAWTLVIDGKGLTGAALTARAFSIGLPFSYAGVNLGGLVVALGIMLFASSTAISWYYYGDRAIVYLFGRGAIRWYQVAYVVALTVGALVKLELVWTFSDIANGLMALPNLVSVLALSGVVLAATRDYFARHPEQ